MKNNNSYVSRRNKVWEEMDEQVLVAMYKQECDIDDIATHLGRTRDGCIKRLTRLGVYEGLRNSPRDRMKRMLNWNKLSKEESSYANHILVKNPSLEDMINFALLVLRHPRPDMSLEFYRKVGKIR
jgi:hypothetical protein